MVAGYGRLREWLGGYGGRNIVTKTTGLSRVTRCIVKKPKKPRFGSTFRVESGKRVVTAKTVDPTRAGYRRWRHWSSDNGASGKPFAGLTSTRQLADAGGSGLGQPPDSRVFAGRQGTALKATKKTRRLPSIRTGRPVPVYPRADRGISTAGSQSVNGRKEKLVRISRTAGGNERPKGDPRPVQFMTSWTRR